MNVNHEKATDEFAGEVVDEFDREFGDDGGWTTAELLGNAALGILALVAIWAMLQALGINVVSWIQGQLGV